MSVTPPLDPAFDQPYSPDLHAVAPISYRLSVRPSPLDVRDYPMALPARISLPPAYALPACAAVLDQDQLGACTANGMDGMYMSAQLNGGRAATPLSRLALYYAERLAEGSVGEDSGANPRDGLMAMKKAGVPLESLWPYDIARFTEAPPATAMADAPNHRIGGFYRVPGLLAAKSALFDRHAVGIALLVFSGMQRTRNGVIPMPDPGEQPEGGHFVYLRGWQDRKDWPGGGYGIARNSWGTSFGVGGDMLIPYAYLGNSTLVSEYWFLRLP